jgi:HSP20 family protein
MDALRREVDRAFRDAGLARAFRPIGRFAFLPGSASRTYPLVNVREDTSCVYVDALAPGLDPKTLQIEVVENHLKIAGEKHGIEGEVKPEAFHRSERAEGHFTRVTSLPSPVEGDKASAEYREGILSITLPKTEAAKPRQVPVTVG